MLVYLTGAAFMAICLVWSSIAGGGFERQHDARQLLLVAFALMGYSLLWPVGLIMFLLMWSGVVRGPSPIELSVWWIIFFDLAAIIGAMLAMCWRLRSR